VRGSIDIEERKMKKITFVLLLLNIVFLYANKVIETKKISGNEYKLIETTAEITYARDGNGEIIGKDLFFYTTQGKIATSDITLKELEPYDIKQKIKIYYVENSYEPDKQLFRVYLQKDDVDWTSVYKSNEVGFNDKVEKEKIGRKPIHGMSGVNMKLVSDDSGNIYTFVGNNGILPYAIFIFIGFIIFSFIRSRSLGGVAIGVLMALFLYFIFFSMPEHEKSVFDFNSKEFYKGSTIAEAREFGNSYAKFKNIYGFQILKDIECTKRRNGSIEYEKCYDVYELNLVLTNYRRITIVCHGDYEQIINDARTLSNKLNKPLFEDI
jgi:hypothetical protein